MPFVKLDAAILDSTVWLDKSARDVFITALLMAVPRTFPEPMQQLGVRALEPTGWDVPPGVYGFVEAAGAAICRRAIVPDDDGITALERLGAPEAGGKSSDFDGRRLARVNGGYLVLNYMRYRQKDHTAAERMRRHRAGKKGGRPSEQPGGLPDDDFAAEE